MKAAPDFAALGVYGTGLSQHARLVTLASSQAGGLPESLRRDSYIFQDKNVREIVCELLADYPMPGGDSLRFHGVRATEHDDAIPGVLSGIHTGPLITLGDKTSHGGSVIEASPHSDTGGKGIARVGDNTTCPKHGPNPIVSGDSTLIIDGKPAARHGDKTACGATLIAGQQATIDNI